ncbi:MAG: ATP-binding protein [Phaeovulum sp.]|uniref:sensor histidine kinase n=1 Tax=Phaeovulum sp. TaxID=2934796 RepID=UPI002732C32D|nr:ATP-binding protein [Phaeovulum sp.]MDP3862761.1 ATP-binding protein [Phaeovulum sp.]
MAEAADLAARPGGRTALSGRWRLYWLVLALGAALLASLPMLAGRDALGLFLGDTARRGDTTLRLAVATMRGQLARFERLPQLIAETALVRALAASPDDPDLVARTNAYFKHIAVLLGASDVYYMDLSGTTRAASNHDTATSFVGGNFAFRPYFYDAAADGQGRFFALGTTSRKRGYYFGAPVSEGGRILGVIAFKVDLDAIEETWRGGDDEIIVTDPEGIIFLASRAEWLFAGIFPLTEERLAQSAATRRYADATLRALPLAETPLRGGHRLAKVTEAGTGAREFLLLSEAMPDVGWTVSVLLDTASARRQLLTALILALLVAGLGSMGLAVMGQRRARLRERLQMQTEAQAELERRVVERTSELANVNVRLEAEIGERTAAEHDLRKAQADLVQASKLAALGQMSAALSHEFNQPLAAARNYADNALTLIDRARVGEARDNIGRILALVDRMTSISKHLRSFARKPGQELVAVNLAEVVAAAQEIAALRLQDTRAELIVDLPADLPQVVGGPVRLQQVLVNLLSNAADAVEAGADRRIELSARASAKGVRLSLRDHGPGVPAGLRERIFDPFFSTKVVGKGLGLGLSISYNIIKDFGGDLKVFNAPGGGALFCLDLRAVAEASGGQAKA